MRRLLACVALAVPLITAFAPSAQAQDDGIFIAPDGPTAREYEIPLEAERRRSHDGVRGAAGVRRSDPVPGDVDAGPAAGLFGRGVTPEAARAQKERHRQASTSDPAQTEDERASEPGLPSVARLESEKSSPDRSMLIAGGAILAIALAGRVLRRRLGLRT